MNFQSEIIKILTKHTELKKAEIENLISTPPDPKLGDYAFPCFKVGKNPKEAADKLKKEIKLPKFLEKLETAGPYLNFFINKSIFAEETLNRIGTEKEKYGESSIGKKETILVEYPGPNTNKPLHLGHMRVMALGDCLANLVKSQGYNTKVVNIINDRGIHICKSMLAYQKWGEGKTPESENVKSDHFVGKYYVLYATKVKENPELEEETKALLQKWEAGDPETIKLWKQMNKWALSGYATTYSTFEMNKFEKEYFESETYKKGKELVVQGVKDGIFKRRNDGAIIIDLEKEELGEKVLLRSDGTSVYITQDLYLAELRQKDFKFDKCIYVVASEQNYHFKVLFTLLKKLGYKFAEGCHHFSFGMVNLPDGKMKSREGTVVDADDFMLEMKQLAETAIKERHKDLDEKEVGSRASIISLAAIKFYLLAVDAVKDLTFDPKKSLAFEGDTGPYVQYTHARASSILRKAKEQKLTITNVDFGTLIHPAELSLIKSLEEFPKKTLLAAENYKPHLISQYLLTLSRNFNEFYHSCPCLKEENKELAKARLLVTKCTKQVIKNGLALLGIKAPEDM